MTTEKPNRRVLKVHYSAKSGRLTVTYEQKRPDGKWDEFSITSADQPHPEFWEAARMLGRPLLELLELPNVVGDPCPACGITSYGAGMSLIGVSYKWEDGMGVTVTASKKLMCSDAPLILNTPFLNAEALPGLLSEGVQFLAERALDYVDGKRAQLDLFPAAGQATQGILDRPQPMTAEEATQGILDGLRAEIRAHDET